MTDTKRYLNKPTRQSACYTQRDLLLYAQGIGCEELRFTYEHDENFAAFPTFPLTLLFSGMDQDVVSFPSEFMQEAPPMPPLKGVVTGLDGERYIEFFKPLPTEATEVVVSQQITGVHKRGKGASVETEATICDSAGEKYCRIVSGAFLVGAKDFKDSGISNSMKLSPPQRPADAIAEIATSKAQAQLYRLSGDYNPLHISPEFAKMVGFGEPILHGLCTFGMSARAVLKTFASNDVGQLKSLRVRFSKPVLPGQTLEVHMWHEQGRVVFITKVKETGAVVINNACAELGSATSRL